MTGTQEWDTQSKPTAPGGPPKPTRSRWATLRGGSNDQVPSSNSTRQTEQPSLAEQLYEADQTLSYRATLWGGETQSLWPPDTHALGARMYPTNEQDRHCCPMLATVGHVAMHVSSWMTLRHAGGMMENFWQRDGASPRTALGAPDSDPWVPPGVAIGKLNTRVATVTRIPGRWSDSPYRAYGHQKTIASEQRQSYHHRQQE
jgi:hypothetical protein